MKNMTLSISVMLLGIGFSLSSVAEINNVTNSGQQVTDLKNSKASLVGTGPNLRTGTKSQNQNKLLDSQTFKAKALGGVNGGGGDPDTIEFMIYADQIASWYSSNGAKSTATALKTVVDQFHQSLRDKNSDGDVIFLSDALFIKSFGEKKPARFLKEISRIFLDRDIWGAFPQEKRLIQVAIELFGIIGADRYQEAQLMFPHIDSILQINTGHTKPVFLRNVSAAEGLALWTTWVKTNSFDFTVSDEFKPAVQCQISIAKDSIVVAGLGQLSKKPISVVADMGNFQQGAIYESEIEKGTFFDTYYSSDDLQNAPQFEGQRHVQLVASSPKDSARVWTVSVFPEVAQYKNVGSAMQPIVVLKWVMDFSKDYILCPTIK